MYDNPDSNTVNEDLARGLDMKANMEQDFWDNEDPSPPPRVNSELSIIANDDDTTVASDVLDNDQTETHFYIEDNAGEVGEEEDYVDNNEMFSQSPNMSRSNSSAKSMVTAKQRSKDETPLTNTEFKLNLSEEEEDISQLIDNDEDALTDDYASLRSPRVINYLTRQPSASHSSYLRRQRLTAASTLDIPVREGGRG